MALRVQDRPLGPVCSPSGHQWGPEGCLPGRKGGVWARQGFPSPAYCPLAGNGERAGDSLLQIWQNQATRAPGILLPLLWIPAPRHLPKLPSFFIKVKNTSLK